MTEEEKWAAYELTMTPEQRERHVEYNAIVEAIAEVVKEYVTGKLAPINERLAGAADAGKLIELGERVSSLHGKLDKILTTQSSQAKHLQSLERKYGEFSGRGKAS